MIHSYIETGLGRLTRLLTNELVEVAVNPDGGVWVERLGDAYMQRTDVTLTPKEAADIALQIASEGTVRMSEKNPVGSASFELRGWLVRAQIVQQPAVRKAHSISMRFFRSDSEVVAPQYLFGEAVSASEKRRAIVEEVADQAGNDIQAALRCCVRNKLNVVVSGGTSSGKTMLARWMVAQIDDEERILTIEDVPDLMPAQPNKVMMVSSRSSDVRSANALLQAALRMRPDRIILSEVTGEDAYTFLKAVNTGHGGSITTVHAESAELAVERMAQTALEAKGQMTYADMIGYVTRSIDVVVHVAKHDGRRGVMQVYQPSRFAAL